MSELEMLRQRAQSDPLIAWAVREIEVMRGRTPMEERIDRIFARLDRLFERLDRLERKP